MFFNNIMKLGRNIYNLGSSFAAIGKSMTIQGRGAIRGLLRDVQEKKASSSNKDEEDEIQAEIRRQNMQKNFEIPEPGPNDHAINAKIESMKHSQGVSDFSGSSYDGPGLPGERTNFNKYQQNYENHQGN